MRILASVSFPDNLIQSAEAAAILGIGRQHFNKLVLAGDVPAVTKLGGTTGARLFDRSVIERIAAERQAVAS